MSEEEIKEARTVIQNASHHFKKENDYDVQLEIDDENYNHLAP
jgi:hypothetical protein